MTYKYYTKKITRTIIINTAISLVLIPVVLGIPDCVPRGIDRSSKMQPISFTLYHSLLVSLNMYIDLLQAYHYQLSTLEREIDELAVQLEEYELLQTIPGVGKKIAATIISEVGEIDRFSHPKKLVAFAGLDPSGV